MSGSCPSLCVIACQRWHASGGAKHTANCRFGAHANCPHSSEASPPPCLQPKGRRVICMAPEKDEMGTVRASSPQQPAMGRPLDVRVRVGRTMSCARPSRLLMRWAASCAASPPLTVRLLEHFVRRLHLLEALLRRHSLLIAGAAPPLHPATHGEWHVPPLAARASWGAAIGRAHAYGRS